MLQDGFTLRLGRTDVCGDSVALRLIRHDPGQARSGRCRASIGNSAPPFRSSLPPRFLLQLPYWDRFQSL